MRYLGSKSRHAKEIVSAILEDSGKLSGVWVEPFVGGGNLIQHVPHTFSRFASDANPHAVAALIQIRDNVESLPDRVTEEEYKECMGKPPNGITSWVRFAVSFGGKFEGGFARSAGRCHCSEQKRSAIKQSRLLQGITLSVLKYSEVNPSGAIIYCDPPYQGTTKYKTEAFDHDGFFDWCRRMKKKGNCVYISEYNAPSDFTVIWEKETPVNFASGRSTSIKKTEKLFKV